MATVLTPHCLNQSARRCRSPVKVPKLRTGSGSRSGPTAATCRVAPMSIAAALAWTGDISMRDRLVLGIHFSAAEGGGGRRWVALQINFLIGIAVGRHHLQVRSNPRTMFDNGVLTHQKADGRSPPGPSIRTARFYATGGPDPRRFARISRSSLS